MRPIQEPITGTESQGTLEQPYHALVQFYHAFNTRDLGEMSRNWEQSEDSAMDNPLGGIKRGWHEIKEVYERIFDGAADVRVEFYDYTVHETKDMFYAVGRERGYSRRGDSEVPLAIRTTRIYKRTGAGWRQIHHHGSIDDPRSLERYQEAVLGKR